MYSVNWPFLMLYETKYLMKIEGNKIFKKGSLGRFEIFNYTRQQMIDLIQLNKKKLMLGKTVKLPKFSIFDGTNYI